MSFAKEKHKAQLCGGALQPDKEYLGFLGHSNPFFHLPLIAWAGNTAGVHPSPVGELIHSIFPLFHFALSVCAGY
jgi:hypothetical protein